MLHPEAPESVIGDPDAYAAWRSEHCEPHEVLGLTHQQRLKFFRAEWFDAQDSPEQIAVENAEMDLDEQIRTGQAPRH